MARETWFRAIIRVEMLVYLLFKWNFSQFTLNTRSVLQKSARNSRICIIDSVIDHYNVVITKKIGTIQNFQNFIIRSLEFLYNYKICSIIQNKQKIYVTIKLSSNILHITTTNHCIHLKSNFHKKNSAKRN